MAAHRRLALLPVAVGVASCLWQQMNGHLHRSSPFLEQAHVGTQPHALCCRSCLAGLSWCCATSSPAAQGRRRKRRLQWLRRQRRCGAAASSTTTDCSALAAGRCPHTGEGVGRGSMVGTEKAALRQQAALLVLTAAKLRGVAASQAACSHPSRPPPASPPPHHHPTPLHSKQDWAGAVAGPVARGGAPAAHAPARLHAARAGGGGSPIPGGGGH